MTFEMNSQNIGGSNNKKQTHNSNQKIWDQVMQGLNFLSFVVSKYTRLIKKLSFSDHLLRVSLKISANKVEKRAFNILILHTIILKF